MSKGTFKNCKVLFLFFFFFMSSAPCIARKLKDVGEVLARKFESLRSLIIDVWMFLNLDNIVERSFEIPLLQMEFSISFQLSLKFFFCYCTWSEDDKLYDLTLIMTFSEDGKLNQSLLMLTWSSKYSILQMLLVFRIWLLLLLAWFKCVCIYLESLYFRTKTWFDTFNFNLRSCILEHTLAYPIVLFIFCYHQNFKGIVQNSFWFDSWHYRAWVTLLQLVTIGS